MKFLINCQFENHTFKNWIFEVENENEAFEMFKKIHGNKKFTDVEIIKVDEKKHNK